MKVLIFRAELCNGCRVCEQVCSQTWFKGEGAERSAIRIGRVADQPDHFQASTCTQCGECIDVCQTLAIKRDAHGIVRIQKNACVGCLSCVGFCPQYAMHAHPDNLIPFKCVACGKCVDACPARALSIADLPEAELTATEKRMKVVV